MKPVLFLVPLFLMNSLAQASVPTCRSLCEGGHFKSAIRAQLFDGLRANITNVNIGSVWGPSYQQRGCEPQYVNSNTDLAGCMNAKNMPWMTSSSIGESINEAMKQKTNGRCEYLIPNRSSIQSAIANRSGARFDSVTGKSLPIKLGSVYQALVAQLETYHCQ